VLNGSSWNNAGGTITAQTGSSVDLTGSVNHYGRDSKFGRNGAGVCCGQQYCLSHRLDQQRHTERAEQRDKLTPSGTITNNGTITLQRDWQPDIFLCPERDRIDWHGFHWC